MFKLKSAAYNVLNNTIIIIKLISYSWVIIHFDNSLCLNLSTSVHFKAYITLGFIFRMNIPKNTLAKWIRRSHASALLSGSIRCIGSNPTLVTFLFPTTIVERIFTYITQIYGLFNL